MEKKNYRGYRGYMGDTLGYWKRKWKLQFRVSGLGFMEFSYLWLARNEEREQTVETILFLGLYEEYYKQPFLHSLLIRDKFRSPEESFVVSKSFDRQIWDSQVSPDELSIAQT